jgi:hypothetical protein
MPLQGTKTHGIHMEPSIVAVVQGIFSSFDAYDCPFRESVESRMLLYPVEGFRLTQLQFSALSYMMQQTEESHALCFRTEGIKSVGEIANSETLVIRQNDYAFYAEAPLVTDELRILLAVVENAIVSPSGYWGLLISQDLHALLGGRREVIDHFKRVYSGWRDDTTEFIRDMESVGERWADITFVKKVLQCCKE